MLSIFVLFLIVDRQISSLFLSDLSTNLEACKRQISLQRNARKNVANLIIIYTLYLIYILYTTYKYKL